VTEKFVLQETRGRVAIITLNRPQVLNAWHRPMRDMLVTALTQAQDDAAVRAVILTGAGDRAFSAGQDLGEAKTFNPERAQAWLEEWRVLYDRLRSLSKPLIMALNGVAAGSAFQVALLGDIRIGHSGVKMGQPEINSGIASVTGPWIMREMIGLARTIELTLTGRMMDAEEAHRLGLINRIVPQGEVLSASLALAEELADKPPIAMALDKARFREVTQAGFKDAIEAGARIHAQAYGTGEPAAMMETFLQKRARQKHD